MNEYQVKRNKQTVFTSTDLFQAVFHVYSVLRDKHGDSVAYNNACKRFFENSQCTINGNKYTIHVTQQ